VHEFVVGYFTDAQRGIREGDWKLIHYPKIDNTQLFNLRDDPFELRDLSTQEAHATTRVRLRTRLDAWLKEHGDDGSAYVRPEK
jgi:arylsulfatase A-like enzyme